MHLCVDVQDLAPGETKVRGLTSPEGPLRAGWIYIIYGGVQGNGSVIAELRSDNASVERFVWTQGQFHQNSTKIQVTGNHTLHLTNPSETESVRYAFYYDQSCNCIGKLIPLHGGFVLFNYVFPEGRTAHFDLFVYDARHTLHGAVATHDESLPTAHWPDDFAILDEKTVTGRAWLNFSIVPEETGTYYVFLEALAGADPNAPIDLTPVIEVEAAKENTATLPLLTLVAFALAAAMLPRRGRDAPATK